MKKSIKSLATLPAQCCLPLGTLSYQINIIFSKYLLKNTLPESLNYRVIERQTKPITGKDAIAKAI